MTTRVLAISGSLRAASHNTQLLRLAQEHAPDGVEILIWDGLAEMPAYNEDLEVDPGEAVDGLRALLSDVDALLIATPEYNFGVPGALKNALDWVVGSGELIDKPVALINASARATHAYASLRETLTTMSGRLIDAASITIPLDGTGLDATGIVNDPSLSATLSAAIAALVDGPSDRQRT